ncbi:hypothetical protein J4E93_004508 [Alternaria ventricosa]|uniref:uncharacterized protein n=1 Tax=Alternaria ventricosa TaxID=1187951 RepID=UPI0020C409E1|nr:uncharacterized protein J4E93_004508 [Alternaria ventricosa]KAI4648097.1 hypothetical protein J4E93_004508 [Alternaria ventricosa]
MSPKDMSFAKAFDELLPLEIKQMIFKWAASDNSSEIQIRLLHDNEDRLHAPTVDLLAKLKDQYSAKAYCQAVEYLTGSMFRWTFSSDTQPHRYLLRVFRNSVPMEVRQRIQHAYLPRVTVRGLVNPDTLSTSLEDLEMMEMGLLLDCSDYLTRLSAKATSDSTSIVMKINRDIAGGISLLPHILPSLKKLDLGLDVIDCCLANPDDLRLCRQGRIKGLLRYGPLTGGLGALANLKDVTSLDVRVYWNDFLHDEQLNGSDFITANGKQWRDHIIKALCLSLPAAKSIVGHPEDPPV